MHQDWISKKGEGVGNATQTFFVILVEVMAMNDGIILYRVLEMSLIIFMARKLGPPWRALVSTAMIGAVMTVQCCHRIVHGLRKRSSILDISSHGAHREIF